MKLKFYFDNHPAYDQVRIFLVGEDANGKKSLCKPMEMIFEEVNPGLIQEPTLTVSGFMSREFLPALANALAEAGYRHESTDKGELLATKKHLEDMRKMAFENTGGGYFEKT